MSIIQRNKNTLQWEMQKDIIAVGKNKPSEIISKIVKFLKNRGVEGKFHEWEIRLRSETPFFREFREIFQKRSFGVHETRNFARNFVQ